MKIWLALMLALAASGCAGTGPVSDCDGFRPIRPTKEDVARMSDQLVGDILAHNEYYAKACRH